MRISRVSCIKLTHMHAKLNGDEDVAKRISDQLKRLEAESQDIISYEQFMEALDGYLKAYILRGYSLPRNWWQNL